MRSSFKLKIIITLLLVIFVVVLFLIYLVYFLSVDDYLNQSDKFIIAAGSFVLLVASASAVTIYLATNKFLKPVNELQKFINRTGQGNYRDKLNIKSKDEIGNLGSALNEMIGAIRKSRIETDDKLDALERELKVHKQNIFYKKDTSELLRQIEHEKNRLAALSSDLKKFKMAADSAYNHIVITDKDGYIIYANEAVERITGFAPEYIVGKKVGSRKLWGGLMDNLFYKKLWKIIKEEKKVFSGEIKNKRKNGEIYIAETTISPMLDEHNEVQFFLGIERDITKQKEVDKAKTEFLSVASHQLRTPLTAVSWYTEMLLSGDAGKISGQQKDFLYEIYKGNRKMVELVNAFLNVSRLEMGTFVISAKENRLEKICDSVIKEITPLIKNKKIKLIKEYDQSLPVMKLDENLTRIIIQNLLTNAIKYSATNGKINIILKKKNQTAEITVKDEGIGIPYHQQDQIFNKLFRADNAIASEYQGTGLGLYIIRMILDRVDGKVSFKSVPDKGSEFVVLLPLTGMQSNTGTKYLTSKL